MKRLVGDTPSHPIPPTQPHGRGHPVSPQQQPARCPLPTAPTARNSSIPTNPRAAQPRSPLPAATVLRGGAQLWGPPNPRTGPYLVRVMRLAVRRGAAGVEGSAGGHGAEGGARGGGGLGTVRGPAATTTTAAAALRLRGGLREGSASPRVGPCGMQWDGVRGEQRPPAPRRAPERGND